MTDLDVSAELPDTSANRVADTSTDTFAKGPSDLGGHIARTHAGTRNAQMDDGPTHTCGTRPGPTPQEAYPLLRVAAAGDPDVAARPGAPGNRVLRPNIKQTPHDHPSNT
jgi:hypothetical protein